jgi:hypothetical protein
MQKKAAIFISSTYEDLREERSEVIKAVLELNHIPVGMEMFSAADEEQWKIIARHIDQADYYIVIVAHRYGTVGPDGISFTEKEYAYAVSQGVPVLGFVIQNDVPWPPQNMESKNSSKLEMFKAKVCARPVSFWTNRNDLATKVVSALTKAFIERPRPGWIRAPSHTDSSQIEQLLKENETLRKQVGVSAGLTLLAQTMQKIERARPRHSHR